MNLRLILIPVAIFISLSCQEEVLTVHDILKDLSRYNSKELTIEGFYVNEFENHSIWTNETDYHKNQFRESSFWIGNLTDSVTLKDANGQKVNISYLFNKNVQMVGVFKSEVDTVGNFIFGHGHMNLWLGEMINVHSIQEIKN